VLVKNNSGSRGGLPDGGQNRMHVKGYSYKRHGKTIHVKGYSKKGTAKRGKRHHKK
jgi:hypothetical protein